MSNLYNRLSRYGSKPAYVSYESDEEELLLKQEKGDYKKGDKYPIMIASSKPLTIIESSPTLINLKRYLVAPYVYSRLLCEKYIYNFGQNNDISNINDFIYIGNHSSGTNLELLKQHGITHIVPLFHHLIHHFRMILNMNTYMHLMISMKI